MVLPTGPGEEITHMTFQPVKPLQVCFACLLCTTAGHTDMTEGMDDVVTEN